MPPKKANNGEGGESASGLTDGENRFIKVMFDNMTQRPDANWDQVASDLGLKDAKCAKERFRQISARHGWRDQGTSPRKTKANTGGSGTLDSKVTKKAAPRTPRKKAKKEEDEDVKDEAEPEGEVKDEELDDDF
jgi:hypothetical protein